MHLFSHSQMCTGTKYANKLHIYKHRQTYTQMASGLNVSRYGIKLKKQIAFAHFDLISI